MSLYAHRLRAGTGSGVQRYTDGLLAGLEQVTTQGWRLMAVSPDPVEPGQGRNVIYRSVPLPRKVIHGLWSLIGLPSLETVAGPADLVHLLSTAIPVPSRAPQVVTIHDLFTLRHPEWFEPRSVRATVKTISRAVRSARRIIAPSSFVARDISTTLDVDPARITIVHEGVSARFTTEQPQSDQTAGLARYEVHGQPYLVMVGLLSPRKNLRMLAEAWAILRSRLGDSTPTLLVIGPPDRGHEKIRDEVRGLGLSTAIRFAGFVPDADLRTLFANALALVHPSLDEGFGLTPLEAMAAGVPALVSDAGSLPEVTGSAAWLLNPHDPAAWAAAVETILQDPDRRASLIASGRERVKGFSWAAAALGTLDVYRQALSEA